MTKQILNRVTVTPENIESVCEFIGTTDQAAEAGIGEVVSVWEFPYSHGVGTLTVYHEAGRAAIEFGGDSDWGDWDETAQTITLDDTDDGQPIVYNVYGERV